MNVKAKTTITIIKEHCELIIYKLNDVIASDFSPEDKKDNSYIEGQIEAFKHVISFISGL